MAHMEIDRGGEVDDDPNEIAVSRVLRGQHVELRDGILEEDEEENHDGPRLGLLEGDSKGREHEPGEADEGEEGRANAARRSRRVRVDREEEADGEVVQSGHADKARAEETAERS